MSEPTVIELNIQLDALKELMLERFRNADRALDKAESALHEYKIASNEWRGALTDARTLMMTRAESLSNLARLEEKLDGAKNSLQSQVDELKAKMKLSEGKTTGTAATWGMIIAIVGLIAAIGMVVVMMVKK